MFPALSRFGRDTPILLNALMRSPSKRKAFPADPDCALLQENNPQCPSFQVLIDVKQFDLEDVRVKIVDKHVIVEANHEDRLDEHGYIARKFTRKLKIPDDVDHSTFRSIMTDNGILIIRALKNTREGAEGDEKIIPISIQDTHDDGYVSTAPEGIKQASVGTSTSSGSSTAAKQPKPADSSESSTARGLLKDLRQVADASSAGGTSPGSTNGSSGVYPVSEHSSAVTSPSPCSEPSPASVVDAAHS